MKDHPGLPKKYIESKKGRICYQEEGEGRAVILIHGGGPGAYGFSNYRRNIGALSGRNRVVVLDLPGFGGSDHRDNSNGIFSTLADALLELMDALGLKTASLVGNSLGGGTSIRFALDHPERVDRLVLMGPGGSLPATSTFPSEGLLRMLTFYDGDGPSLEKLERVLDLLVFDRSTITRELVEERYRTATLPQTLSNPPLRGQAHHPNNELWKADLDKLPHPTLLIWGREDRVLPLDMAFILLKRIPKADLHIFSNCGHWAQWERAEEFNQLVGNFLAA
ncbi:4,5:9,10-diseco-3-hydroxy-5,9,17-trioxoandrosta-1(10),2-diene-4-oate hydrolase [Aliidongia dinghuensis]|uniref:4,5:9,10-diseco-3-hydroxy-5,9,17-trioxoandrosta-1(10),2-diene-4-oate hydrolase n=1 Tax=Aliidongia dinghuensis TaxID=1867774 RepID=A0A8J3E755_9PROT|nr:alpha/beta fold hydrolase [Aliidongia dinghuensis]GGF51094.1 4,5:9,10-diseco-3-hydroxy-5,9,17-trioxoandrosta-1(10),2-diene-4-oate hydrolase [Aliidongia dinghuensis]